MAVGMFLFSAVDALAKYLTDEFAPFSDCLDKTAWAGLWHLSFAGDVWPSYLHYNSSCSATGAGNSGSRGPPLFIIAISQVPLADAITVTFCPLVVTILSAVLLAEKVGLHRWSAIIASFTGTVIVIRPGFENFHPALLLVFLAAILFAGRQNYFTCK